MITKQQLINLVESARYAENLQCKRDKTSIRLREEAEESLQRELAALLEQTSCADYVSFSDVARKRCSEQAQYASRAIDGRHGYPHIGKGMRFEGDPRDGSAACWAKCCGGDPKCRARGQVVR